jgi:GntP family gluconate:H+ symporter
MSETYLLGVLALTIGWIIFSGSRLKWSPLFSLLSAALAFGFLTGMGGAQTLEAMAQGFGSLMGQIGLVIVLGSMLGALLEDSGSVQQLGQALVQGRSGRPALGLALLGMLLGIPVFCDSGFIILIGLAKSMAAATATPLPVMSLSLAGGLYTTHTLVPPTPGPVAAAGNLGISSTLGLVMLLGIVVALPVAIAVYVFAQKRGGAIPFDPAKAMHEASAAVAGSTTRALVLIVLPVALIAVGSTLELLNMDFIGSAAVIFLGKPLVALLLSVALGILFFLKTGIVRPSVEKGIYQSGPILILTGCGGALGAVLKASPLATVVSDWIQVQSYSGIGFLLIGFLISALFKTAQGSTTSAMVLVSALLAPLVAQAGMDQPVELALLVLAIGAGAMTVSHANDSYFWVVSQFSGFDLRSGYRGITLMTLVQGLVAFAMVVLLYVALV